MKEKILIMLIAFSVGSIFAQTDSLTFQKDIENLSKKIVVLEKDVQVLQQLDSNQVLEFKKLKNQMDNIISENIKIKGNIKSLNNSHRLLEKQFQSFKKNFDKHKQIIKNSIDSLEQIVYKNSKDILITADELGIKIEKSNKSTNQSISELNKTLSKNTLYWIIAVLVVTLLVLLVFVFLRKQIFKQKTDLDSNLKDTRKVLEEEGINLDNKLIEVLETQLKIINNSNSNTEKEPDHTLALKVADEIIRINKNLTRMDEKTKGLKQLTASVKRIQDNFASNGYELVEMLGKSYNDGMKVSANFIPDDDLEAGQQIITRIIKPQVNYKGVMIQSAQIEVSQG